MAPFSIVDVFDEVDDKLYALNGLEQLYYEILNEHAPLKQTVVRGKPGTIYDGTMVQGNKVPKQIMVAIYERSDERKS